MDTNRSFETWKNTPDPVMPVVLVETETVRVIEPGPLTATGKVTRKLNELKSQATDQVDAVKRTLQEKVDEVKPIVTSKVNSVTSKVNSVRDQLDSKVVTMRNQVEAKATMLRTDVETRVGALKSKAEMELTSLRDDVRTNPIKWAGISAGAGMGIGLVSRWMHHRAKVNARRVPQIVIIESC